MATIFHLALAGDWAAAQQAGAYTVSTRGRTLAEEGFIHASRGDQWPGVRDAFYGDVDEPLVLLQIDTDLLDVPVVDEPPVPGARETFPHIYGPLPVSAVVKAIPVPSRGTGPVAGAHSPGPRAARPTPGEFSRQYFREMFFNAAMACIVLAAGTAGMALGGLAGSEAGPGLGGLAGVVAGAAGAVLLYRRRHRHA